VGIRLITYLYLLNYKCISTTHFAALNSNCQACKRHIQSNAIHIICVRIKASLKRCAKLLPHWPWLQVETLNSSGMYISVCITLNSCFQCPACFVFFIFFCEAEIGKIQTNFQLQLWFTRILFTNRIRASFLFLFFKHVAPSAGNCHGFEFFLLADVIEPQQRTKRRPFNIRRFSCKSVYTVYKVLKALDDINTIEYLCLDVYNSVCLWFVLNILEYLTFSIARIHLLTWLFRNQMVASAILALAHCGNLSWPKSSTSRRIYLLLLFFFKF
jgi:hypothetical protein